ncbi:hypothetical protein L6452_09785 [Arctium lappa]|uniref:Uncharacterized protein n=1 Tax=Arctium lappa TaxID=4217 RepID=A0ACB9DLF8_ARCLA|nr:hypothetical protein L6452_09785 [Arctium lappa]
MKQFKVFYLLILILLTTSLAKADLDSAKPGCNNSCGYVSIPYPFGIGANCSINKWYAVDCNSSIPYLSAFSNQLEVLSVNLDDQVVTVNISKISDCQINPPHNNNHIQSVDLGESPFLFSKSHNVFIVKGCGNAVIREDGIMVTGCSTSCSNDTTIGDRNHCFGFGCCRTTIPHYLKSFSMDLTHLKRLGGDGDCPPAFLVDETYDWFSYPKILVRNNSTFEFVSQKKKRNNSIVPVSLVWTLTDDDLKELHTSCWEEKPWRVTLELSNRSSVSSKKCSCGSGRQGNPYLHYQCQESEECRDCRGNGGICNNDDRYPNDFNRSRRFFCGNPVVYKHDSTQDFRRSKSPVGVILGVSISIGLLFLAKIIYKLHKVIKKTKTKMRKERFFKRNGGILLKQQEVLDTASVDKTILFTSKELEKATDNFNDNRILGRGGQGTVYKGMLVDGRIVAVKRSTVVDESQLQQFINEVVILSQVNHRNVVKLLGCCLETEVPLLVSEFIPNGTLYDLIQDDSGEFPISLNLILQIATEVAGALSYLHSASSVPIYHRDIKTTNILLDEKYRAKVSDFGTSRFVSMDQTHLTTLVKGTFGYLDPEYFQSSQFTEKSDVYSFGVVLLELLTREKPISLTRFGENRSLAAHVGPEGH